MQKNEKVIDSVRLHAQEREALLDALDLTHLAPPEHPGEVLIGGWTPRLSRL